MRCAIKNLMFTSLLAIGAGCAVNRDSSLAGKEFHDGQLQAERDLRSGQAVYYVYRTVGNHETYPGTSLPIKDAGSDAVAPGRAAFIAGYNSIVVADAEEHIRNSSIPPPSVDPR